MCQAKVVLLEGDREEEVMKDVIWLEASSGQVSLRTFFDPPKTIEGTIEKIDFLKHIVYIRREKDG
ncbi:CooT family nickel-binding protein [Thermosulfuriphilus sp.]